MNPAYLTAATIHYPIYPKIIMNKERLESLASERNNPCVTISMNTHRDQGNAKNRIVIQSLLKEASERVMNEFGKRSVSELLDKIETLEEELDASCNLKSLHIFLSNSTKEIIKSPWPTPRNNVQVDESFAVKPLIKEFNRTEEYLVLLISESGVKLFRAFNEAISEEITDFGFPFTENLQVLANQDTPGEAKQVDHLVREYLLKIDKAIDGMDKATGIYCIVVSTIDNFNRLLQVADKPMIYHGHVHINYKDAGHINLATEAWKIVNALQTKSRTAAIIEMQEAVGQGKVITDLADILKAAKEGRGDLLIVDNDFHRPVKMTGEYSFDLVNDVTGAGVIDDITDDIAWEIISNKGRAIFTSQEGIESLGDITLKIRY